jgi:hypothetical protein
MAKSTPLFSIVLVLVLNSCTMDKRLYRPGYDIKWKNSMPQAKDISSTESVNSGNNSSKEQQAPAASAEQTPVNPVEINEETLVASNEKTVVPIKNQVIDLALKVLPFKKVPLIQKQKQEVKAIPAEKNTLLMRILIGLLVFLLILLVISLLT